MVLEQLCSGGEAMLLTMLSIALLNCSLVLSLISKTCRQFGWSTAREFNLLSRQLVLLSLIAVSVRFILE